MNKNRIFRRECRASGQLTAKPISIKGTERKSGGRASKAVELTSGGLPCVPACAGTERLARDVDRMAEVSRGHSSPSRGGFASTNVAIARGRFPRVQARDHADQGPNGESGK